MKIINLDQLKTLILIKGGQKRVGSFLPPPSLSHNRISYVSSTSVLGAAHYLLTTWRSPSSIERCRRPTGDSHE